MSYQFNQPPVPARMSTGKKIGIGCSGCAGVALVGLLFVGCSAAVVGTSASDSGGSESSTSAQADPTPASDESAESHQLGDTVPHGSFEFVVLQVETGVGSVEGSYGLEHTARDSYTVIELEATNTSSSAEYLEGSNQVLMDDEGRMYERDISASSGDQLFLDKINPGATASATLVYDIPDSAEIEYMLVNGASMLEDGVRVELDL